MHDSRGIRGDFEENYSALSSAPPQSTRTPGVIISPPQASASLVPGGLHLHTLKREISLGTTRLVTPPLSKRVILIHGSPCQLPPPRLASDKKRPRWRRKRDAREGLCVFLFRLSMSNFVPNECCSFIYMCICFESWYLVVCFIRKIRQRQRCRKGRCRDILLFR